MLFSSSEKQTTTTNFEKRNRSINQSMPLGSVGVIFSSVVAVDSFGKVVFRNSQSLLPPSPKQETMKLGCRLDSPLGLGVCACTRAVGDVTLGNDGRGWTVAWDPEHSIKMWVRQMTSRERKHESCCSTKIRVEMVPTPDRRRDSQHKNASHSSRSRSRSRSKSKPSLFSPSANIRPRSRSRLMPDMIAGGGGPWDFSDVRSSPVQGRRYTARDNEHDNPKGYGYDYYDPDVEIASSSMRARNRIALEEMVHAFRKRSPAEAIRVLSTAVESTPDALQLAQDAELLAEHLHSRSGSLYMFLRGAALLLKSTR